MTIYEETDAAAVEGGEGDGENEKEGNWVEIEQIVLSDYETKVRDIFVIIYIYKRCTNNVHHRSLVLLLILGGNACFNGGKGVSKLYVHVIDIAPCHVHLIIL